MATMRVPVEGGPFAGRKFEVELDPAGKPPENFPPVEFFEIHDAQGFVHTIEHLYVREPTQATEPPWRYRWPHD